MVAMFLQFTCLVPIAFPAGKLQNMATSHIFKMPFLET
jgi:hypothetical protein